MLFVFHGISSISRFLTWCILLKWCVLLQRNRTRMPFIQYVFQLIDYFFKSLRWKSPVPNLLSKFHLSVVEKAVSDKVSGTSCSLNPKIQLEEGGRRIKFSKEAPHLLENWLLKGLNNRIWAFVCATFYSPFEHRRSI